MWSATAVFMYTFETCDLMISNQIVYDLIMVSAILLHLFDNSGGVVKNVYDGMTIDGIEFRASYPSSGDSWLVTCDGDDLPDWLEITLTDGESDGKFNNSVTAQVTAQPLLQGCDYCEAHVRFEIPGAYIDYVFMQGDDPGQGTIDPLDVNIATVNMIVDIILGADVDEATRQRYDFNHDGEINIADVNYVIRFILSMQ